jgi:hypothetical protein
MRARIWDERSGGVAEVPRGLRAAGGDAASRGDIGTGGALLGLQTCDAGSGQPYASRPSGSKGWSSKD